MAVIKSKINIASQAYKDNYALMEGKLKSVQEIYKESLFQGEEKHLVRTKASGKMLARERIELLLDEDSFFLELLPISGHGVKGGFGTGGTLVAGIGMVSGKMVLIAANVGSLKGGSFDLSTLKKSLRLNEIATQNKLHFINIVESAGANLPDQAHVFNLGGNNFKEITRRSKNGLVTVSLVMGNSTAGGAYVPGMSDYSVFVKNQAKVFLAGPPLVKMATQEVVDDETLGGAEMHSKISGVSDYLAEDELDGIRITRDIIANLTTNEPYFKPDAFLPPKYSAEEIMGIVQADVRKSFDCRELIARIVDGSDFSEFKKDWGTTLVTGFAKIHGYPVGIIGNNGVLFNNEANKGAHFIQLCNRQNIPLLFLQNITGFMVGKDYEQSGIIKDGAKMINAVSNSEVPSITIIVGSSYGAGNYAMNGQAYNPNFIFSYPNSMIAVMGSEQLSGVMEMVSRQAALKNGDEYNEEKAAQIKAMMKAEIERQSNAIYASSNMWDDGIVDPKETRNYLSICLSVIYQNEIKSENKYGVYRM